MSASKHTPKKNACPPPEAAAASAMYAIIFLGAGSMSMLVGEKTGLSWKAVDFLTQPVPLARDVYRGGRIGRQTMDRCVKVMEDFGALIREYGEGIDLQVRFLATNILQDVSNMDTFINRLHIASGLRLRVIDDGEMTRLIYMGVRDLLEQNAELQKKRVLVVHVGPGNTRILLFERGRITRYSSYRLGTHRTGEAVGEVEYGDSEAELALLREHIRSQVDQIGHDFGHSGKPDTLILLGDEIQRLQRRGHAATTFESMDALARSLAELSFEQRMTEYETDFSSVGSLLPAVLINLSLAKSICPEHILVPIRDYEIEFLSSLVASASEEDALQSEVLHFASLLADRYKVDRGHSKQVAALCLSLFDQLADLHRLGAHDRLLLHVAAILHEVGTYINPKRHHRHSQYIILNSEIFGLSRPDVELIALLARYHRHGAPTTDEPSYAELEQPDRLRVQKLAAILRVADALERSHAQRIRDFKIRYNARRLELLVPGIHDITIEDMAMRLKGDLFSDIFGYDIAIVPMGATPDKRRA